MSTKLAHQTQKAAGIGNGMRTATITAVSPVTISVSGGEFSSGVGVLDSYTPAVGDTVAVFRQDSSWLIMGAIAPPAGGLAPRNTQTGTVLVSIAAATSSLTAVTFDVPFPVAPVVVPNMDTAPGPSARVGTRAVTITTDGFTLYAFATDNVATTITNVPVSYTATARS